MKSIVFNKSKVTKDEIERTVRKARGIISSKDGKILLVKYKGIYMLPGGSIEDENIKDSLQRELLEEAGIDTAKLEDNPFLKIDCYDRNYYDRKFKKNITRLTETYFYLGETTQGINTEKQSLTESEMNGDFSISFEDLENIEDLVKNNKSDNSKKDNFDREILTVLNEYKNYVEFK